MSRVPTSAALLLSLALLGCGAEHNLGVLLSPPDVAFTMPSDGASFDEGTAVSLSAIVGDAGDAAVDLTVVWTSSIDGTLEPLPTREDGVSTVISSTLTPGAHRITVTAVDSDGQSGEDALSVAIVDLPDAPEIVLIHPSVGDVAYEGRAYEVVARVSDDRDAPEQLVLDVESDLDGFVCAPPVDGLGEARCSVVYSVGRHHLTLTATDLDGFVGVATAWLTVASGADLDDDLDGFTENQGDCDDADPDVRPLATEFCDLIDNDCNGLIDDGTSCYDDDGDGFTEEEGDCDDDDETIHPDAEDVWYDGVDSNCDEASDLDADGDGFEVGVDCDDQRMSVFPGADEACNGIDDDCDGIPDQGTSCFDDDGDGFTEDEGDCDDADAGISPDAEEIWYDDIDSDCDRGSDFDADGDGFDLADDCDDTEEGVNPDAVEICNAIDEDCDGVADQGTSCFDDDGDGLSEDEGDCNDADPAVFPGAEDVWYDGVDANCDNLDDFDADADGYDRDSDCDDAQASVNPGAIEVCNGIDEDCDGMPDQGTSCFDDDGDGFSEEDGDCNDADPSVFPGAVETWYDGVDSDCDLHDDFDADFDGFGRDADCDDTRAGVNPDADEVCNELDDDCDNEVDEGVTTAFYLDADGDGYGSTTATWACTEPAGHVGDRTDCYDSNRLAYPGSSHWSSSDRGDGSYDFNCDGSTSRLHTESDQWFCTSTFYVVGSVLESGNGWYGGGQPSCGQTRSWATGCDYDTDWFLGTHDVHGPSSTQNYTQSCR